MIKTKLISKDNGFCKFISQDGKEIFSEYLDSLNVGYIYYFNTIINGFSTISDQEGNVFNVLIY